MRICVVGGTGFIGTHVVRKLLSGDHSVTVLHRGSTRSDCSSTARVVHGSRERLCELRESIANDGIDVVIDMSAHSEADAKALVQACSGWSRRAVVVSSQDVYRAYGRLTGLEPGPPIETPLSEDSPLRQNLFPYGAKRPDYEKILVERIVMEARELRGTVLRLPMVYGPGDGQHRLYPHLKRMDDGRPFILMTDSAAHWRWTRGYVEDVATCIAKAAVDVATSGRIWNLGHPDALTLKQWVESIARVVGWKGEIITCPREQMPKELVLRLNLDQQMDSDTSRFAKQVGGMELIEFDEGLRRTIDWERAHPPSETDPAAFNYELEDNCVAELRRTKP
jgi:nucleoside-diphosphate-sugar epimerase